MKKQHLKTFALILTSSIVIYACKKNDLAILENSNVQLSSTNTTNPQTNLSLGKPTLAEFASEAETEEEVEFFVNTVITDNSSIVIQALNSNKDLQAKPKVGFKWHGKGGKEGCKKPIGLCIIIPLVTASEANVNLMIYQNKYILLFDKGQTDNGLTSDGYLPILKDIHVSAEITIPSGIYKANFDINRNEYSAVGLNIQ